MPLPYALAALWFIAGFLLCKIIDHHKITQAFISGYIAATLTKE